MKRSALLLFCVALLVALAAYGVPVKTNGACDAGYCETTCGDDFGYCISLCAGNPNLGNARGACMSGCAILRDQCIPTCHDQCGPQPY